MDISKELSTGIGLSLLFFVIVAILMVLKIQSSQINSLNPISTSSSTSFSLDTVKIHNSQKDCWIVINNNVYDATNYLGKHAGGAGAIAPYCGSDATKAFESMKKHTTKAASDLASLIIGTIK